MTAWPGTAVEGGAPPVDADPPPVDRSPLEHEVEMDLTSAASLAQALHAAVGRVVLGAPGPVTVAIAAAISGGHLLIEDVPGTGKTVLGRTLATALGAELSRIQGHTDLLPTDVTGVSVYSPERGDWRFHPGPVFAHVVLLDELNRTPPRTQSALLEAMAEEQVTVDGARWPLPRPHLVIATQNPHGQHGTFPLVESQLDRFALSTPLGYPDAQTELRLSLGQGGRGELDRLQPVCSTADWTRLVAATARVLVAPAVAEYAVLLARKTRDPGMARLGASPRASITLVRSAQAHALLEGRDYATPGDVQAMAIPGLAHRIVADGGPDHRLAVVQEVLRTTPAPRP
jgi:MoxR-like ATPase